MPDIPWRILTQHGNRRPIRLPVGLQWRLEKVREIVLWRLCAAILELVSRIRVLRVVPRKALIPVERLLIHLDRNGLFDADFYLDRNRDVRDAGLDPLRHYLRHGWREGRSPNDCIDSPDGAESKNDSSACWFCATESRTFCASSSRIS